MRLKGKVVFAGIASLAIATAAVAGVVAERSHVLTVALPDGSVEHIHYSGDVAPKVVIAPVAPIDTSWDMLAPVALFDGGFGASPFAMFDRIAAAMDRQANDMMQQAAMLAAQPLGAGHGFTMTSARNLPAGTVSYSFVSTSNGNGTCNQSVQVTSYGADHQPKVVRHSSGDCSAMATSAPAPVARHEDAARPVAPLVPVKLDAPAKPAPVPANRI